LGAQVVNAPSGGERAVGSNFGVFALPNGDYKQDGVIGAADYAVWRKTIGGTMAYDAWRERFGSAAGSGGQSVPESTNTLAALILLFCHGHRGAAKRRRQ
jgi:hypothetical protein